MGILTPTYYWVDDHPLTQGTNGSLDPSTYEMDSFLPKKHSQKPLHLSLDVRASHLPVPLNGHRIPKRWFFCVGFRFVDENERAIYCKSLTWIKAFVSLCLSRAHPLLPCEEWTHVSGMVVHGPKWKEKASTWRFHQGSKTMYPTCYVSFERFSLLNSPFVAVPGQLFPKANHQPCQYEFQEWVQ